MFGLRKRAGGEMPIGEAAWSAVEGGTPQEPTFIRRNHGVAHLAGAPGWSTLVVVEIPFADADETGLPGPADFDRLNAVEDGLAALGADAEQAVLAVVVTRAGARRFLVYTRDEVALRPRIEQATGPLDGPTVGYGVTDDPGWRHYSAFTALR